MMPKLLGFDAVVVVTLNQLVKLNQPSWENGLCYPCSEAGVAVNEATQL